MKILGIETSCDDTGAAVLAASKVGGFKVLSNIVASQIEVHKKYGGVFPMMAKREHQKNLVPVLEEALKKAGLLKKAKKKMTGEQLKTLEKILEREDGLLEPTKSFLESYKKPEIDLISITQGPGLEPCLWVGVNFAKVLSSFWNIKVVPTNHIESHILVNYLENKKISFPALALVVSGGHTQLILIKGVEKYRILGETRDDAAGECFDKCAKLLNLGYPGGPVISKLAEKNIKGSIQLPRPMIGTKDYDFSFSGLKTAVLYQIRKDGNKAKNQKYKKEMSSEIQQAVIDVLLKKTIKAMKDFNAKSLILGGGVSANQELKKQFKDKLEKELPKTKFFVPKPDLSTDNALMVAIAGFYHKKNTVDWKKIEADGNLRISK